MEKPSGSERSMAVLDLSNITELKKKQIETSSSQLDLMNNFRELVADCLEDLNQWILDSDAGSLIIFFEELINRGNEEVDIMQLTLAIHTIKNVKNFESMKGAPTKDDDDFFSILNKSIEGKIVILFKYILPNLD